MNQVPDGRDTDIRICCSEVAEVTVLDPADGAEVVDVVVVTITATVVGAAAFPLFN